MLGTGQRKILTLSWLLMLTALCQLVLAAPGDIVYQEDFQGGDAGGWTMVAGDGSVGVADFPAGSGDYSFYTCCGVVDARSPIINTAVSGAQVSLTIQRGANTIGSNKPEGADDLDIYFLNAANTWQFMTRLDADGDAGEILNTVFTLDSGLLHENFRIRLYQRNGNNNSDYWHLREVEIVEAGASGGLGSLCDAFDQGLGNWTVTSYGGEVDVTSQTANSPSTSLAMFGGGVRIHSRPLDLSNTTGARLKLWIRRGDDAFSEDPDSGEDLQLGYIDGNGAFQQLDYLAGAGTPGEIFTYDIGLPAAALHDAFQVRIGVIDGNGGQNDYWHVDDVCVEADRVAHHFALSHDGSGVNCQAEPVRLSAHDQNHFVVENHSGTVGLSTDTGNGDWSLLQGAGSLANNGNGSGNYTFAASDKGEVLLGLKDTYLETVNVDAVQGSLNETATEDADLVFAATGFNFLVGGSPAQIGTQIAAKPSNVAPNETTLALQAIRSSDETGACEAAFQGNENVELAFSCETPASCAGRSIFVNDNAIAGNDARALSAYTTLALDFGDDTQDRAEIVINYEDAGSIRLHARKVLDPSTEVMAGSSNAFTVRPFGFDVTVDQGAVSTTNPAATDGFGPAFERAGDAFRVSVTAIGWQAVDDGNADGIPDGHNDTDPATLADLSDNLVLPNFARETANADNVVLSARLIAPAGGNNPGLSGNTTVSSFSSGSGSASGVSWQEAGIIEIDADLADDDYHGTGDIPARSGHVGRFIPDHFTTEVAAHGCSDSAKFTYSGQPLGEFVVTARTAAGDATQNYAAADGFSRNVTITETTGADGNVFNGSIPADNFSGGSVSVDATPSGIGFEFNDKDTSPVTITLRATDTDGVSSQGHAEGSTEIRSGRFSVGNADAFVVTNAVSALNIETHDGFEWVEEVQDTCTVFNTGNLSLGNYSGNLGANESGIDASETVFVNGSGHATMTPPGAGNDGSMELHYNVESWLEYDWEGSGARDPFGTIRFHEIYQSEPGLIHRQEIVP